MRIITAKEMRMLEQESVNRGVSLDKLKDNAGNALSSFIINLNKGRKIVFLAGRGNNGGDCYVKEVTEFIEAVVDGLPFRTADVQSVYETMKVVFNEKEISKKK